MKVLIENAINSIENDSELLTISRKMRHAMGMFGIMSDIFSFLQKKYDFREDALLNNISDGSHKIIRLRYGFAKNNSDKFLVTTK
jgi:hypothetical protein